MFLSRFVIVDSIYLTVNHHKYIIVDSIYLTVNHHKYIIVDNDDELMLNNEIKLNNKYKEHIEQ